MIQNSGESMKNDNRLIEKYLLGELQEQEKHEFEKRLHSDEALLHEYELRKKVNDAILEQDVMQLRISMYSLMNGTTSVLGFRTGRFFYWQLAAAVFITFFVIKSFFLNIDKPINQNTLFAEYYQTCPSYKLSRNGNEQNAINLLFIQAFTDYENKHFAAAEKSFEMISQSDSSEKMAKFYLALTQIELNKLTEAKENLTSLMQNENHLFYEQSTWYLALVYLKENKLNESKQLLNIIISEDFYCSEQARKLLRELN